MNKMRSPFGVKTRCTGGYPQYNSPPAPKTNSDGEHHGEDRVPTDKSKEQNWYLFSPVEGTVIRSNKNDDYGNCVVLAADNGFWVLLAHLQTREVKLGQRVLIGQRVGIAGNTGYSKGRHLHVEVVDMRGYPAKWCGYKEHLKHLLKPSEYIDFDKFEAEKEDFNVVIWKNGSTPEPVYQTTADCKNKKNPIGSLDPREQCECYGKVDGCYLVVYTINGTKTKKTGFVGYAGGVK